MLYSLIDLMNLASTRLILGSGYSSYSEVRASFRLRPTSAPPMATTKRRRPSPSCMFMPTASPQVAAQLGGASGDALPILMAGRDFGTIVEQRRSTVLQLQTVRPENFDLAGFSLDDGEATQSSVSPWAGSKPVARYMHIQQHWPRPF